MVVAIYLLCTVTSGCCAALLFGAYTRSRLRLLLLSGWCFVGLTITNALVVLDKIFLPNVDLLAVRLTAQLVSLSLLLIGLLWRDD